MGDNEPWEESANFTPTSCRELPVEGKFHKQFANQEKCSILSARMIIKPSTFAEFEKCQPNQDFRGQGMTPEHVNFDSK